MPVEVTIRPVCLLVITSKWNACECVSLKKLIGLLIYLRRTYWHHEFETTGSAFLWMMTMIRILRDLKANTWPQLICWAYARGKNYRVKNRSRLICRVNSYASIYGMCVCVSVRVLHKCVQDTSFRNLYRILQILVDLIASYDWLRDFVQYLLSIRTHWFNKRTKLIEYIEWLAVLSKVIQNNGLVVIDNTLVNILQVSDVLQVEPWLKINNVWK